MYPVVRKAVLLAVVLMGALTACAQPSTAMIILEDDLYLDISPISLSLHPFQRGTFELDFQNYGEEATRVAIEARSPGGSRVFVNPDLITVRGGTSETVEVEVESLVTYLSGGSSDILVTFSWGRNLTWEDGVVDPATVEGSNGIVLEVDDDLYVSHPLYVGLAITCVAVPIGALVVWYLRVRAKRSSGPR